jgi:hypothetical protein
MHEDVDAEFLTLDPIRIHRTNFPTNDPDDPSWLVCHTSLDPANGTPIRLTTGNPAIAINNVGSNVNGAGMLRK